MTGRFDHIRTRADLERPVSEGGMSMGAGRKVVGWREGVCSSPDTKHHYTAVSNVQSVEHFVCDFCGDSYYD